MVNTGCSIHRNSHTNFFLAGNCLKYMSMLKHKQARRAKQSVKTCIFVSKLRINLQNAMYSANCFSLYIRFCQGFEQKKPFKNMALSLF